MTLCGGVIEREALCRVRADGVRVRWRLLRAWLSVCLDVDSVVWWSVALWSVAPGAV